MEYKETALYQVSGCYKGKYCEACLRVLTDEASRLGQAIETVELKPRREKEPTVNPEPRPPEEGDVLKERWQRPQERSVLTTTRRELWPLTPRELTETYGKGYHILVKMGYTRENELRTGSARAPLRVGEPRTSRPGLRTPDESGGSVFHGGNCVPESASDARGDQGEGEWARPGPLDSPGLRRFLIEQGLQNYCYISHIAINYRGDDRPKKRLESWLERLFFLERFIDEDGKDCVRVRNHPIG